MFFTITTTFIVVRTLIRITFYSIKFTLHSHDVCSVNVFDLFIPVIMLNTLRFNSPVLFGTHTLLDKSLRVLQLTIHLSNLTING